MKAKTDNPRFRRWPPTEHEAILAFSERYADASGYAVVSQVRNGTGFTRSPRTADALMFSLWPSRGITITGIEYKRTRSDFQREIKDGLKAEDIAAYCHHWAILAPVDLINPSELPPLWGLYTVNQTGRIHTAKKPPPQEQVKALDYIFVAAIVRATLRHQTNDAELAAARAQGIKDGKDRARIDADRHERNDKNYTELAQQISRFENASGLSLRYLDEPRLTQLGYHVARYLRDPDHFIKRLEQERTSINSLLDTLTHTIQNLSSKQVGDKKDGK